MIDARSAPSPFRFVVFVALLAIAVGIFARVFALGTPLFWQDEAFTALRVTGHLQDDYFKLFDGRVRTVADVRAFESLEPGRGVPAVVSALAKEDPHHSPLFYVLDRVWVGAFGTSAAGFRGLSVACGIVGIGLAFALGAALSRSRTAGFVTAGLFAVSPIFVLYARQAREYALFACAVMLATLALLGALRSGGARAWILYAATVALGFYVDPIFVLVAAAHAISIALEPGTRAVRLRRIGTWALAAALGAVAFVPWALNALASRANIGDQLDWGESSYPLRALAQKWAFNIGALFFDGEFRTLELAPIALAVVLAALALVALFAVRGDRAVARIVLPLGLVTFVVLVGRDVAYHSHFATIARYLTPLWLAWILAIGSILASALRAPASPRVRTLATATFAAFACAGIASATIRGISENWWDNNDQIAYQAVARTIDRVPSPLVLSERHPHVPLVLERYLRPSDRLVLFFETPPRALPGGDAFLVEPSASVLADVDRRVAGGYDVANVSPKRTTIIASFHRTSLRGTAVRPRDPANALWLLRPRTPEKSAELRLPCSKRSPASPCEP